MQELGSQGRRRRSTGPSMRLQASRGPRTSVRDMVPSALRSPKQVPRGRAPSSGRRAGRRMAGK
eukprot:14163424-Heterocapsa_arctica.AAC.1